MMILKTNKTSTKGSRQKKIEIKRIRTKVEIASTKKAKLHFWGRREKKREKYRSTNDKSCHQRRHMPHQHEEKMMMLPTT
jgi:hypothetical protein